MNNIFWKSLSILVSISMLVGCAHSEAQLEEMKLSSRHYGADLNLMPFNTDFERYDYHDPRSHFTYTFEDSDLATLRTSLVISIKGARHFTNVRDIDAPRTSILPDGLRLYIDFERMGVSQKVSFLVEIVGEIRLTDDSGRVLGKKAIGIREKGTMTLSAAKNKAIKQFVQEVEQLLNAA